MNPKKYIESSKREVKGEDKAWIDDLLLHLPQGGMIFEVGSATSRDADYIEGMNPFMNVTRSDKNIEFVEYMQTLGEKARVFDVLRDSFEEKEIYEAFFANRIINHFTLQEVFQMMSKMKEHLQSEGYISLSFPLGDNTTLIDWNNLPGNVFCRYHTKSEIEEITTTLTLRSVYFYETSDNKMCYVTLQK